MIKASRYVTHMNNNFQIGVNYCLLQSSQWFTSEAQKSFSWDIQPFTRCLEANRWNTMYCSMIRHLKSSITRWLSYLDSNLMEGSKVRGFFHHILYVLSGLYQNLTHFVGETGSLWWHYVHTWSTISPSWNAVPGEELFKLGQIFSRSIIIHT